MPPRILITWMNFDVAHPHIGRPLVDAGLDLQIAPKTGARSPAELRELLRDCVAAIVSTDPFDAGVLENSPELRVIARIGVGTDSVDMEAATRSGVAVTTTPGANDATTADHTLALLLAAVRRVLENDRSVRCGEWSRADHLTPWELNGRTVGIVGYGKIGRAVARRLAGFEVEVVVYDPGVDETEAGAEVVSLEDLLERSDIVSLHAPLDETTRGMVGAREIELLGPDGILVNTGRGGLVDEAELIAALDEGRLRAAALDVFRDEPLGDSPLTGMPQVVLSPHIGGISDHSIERMLERASRQVLNVLAGDGSDSGIVNPAALRHPKFAMPVIDVPVVQGLS